MGGGRRDRPEAAELISGPGSREIACEGGRDGGRGGQQADGDRGHGDVVVFQGLISNTETGRAGAHALLDADPHITAVVAFSDPLALGARIAARERGLGLPAELSIVGFDDSADFSEGLTTVRQPLREKGRLAAELLFELLNGNETTQDVELPTELVIRGSTTRRH